MIQIIVEKIKAASDPTEVVDLWRSVMSEYSIQDIVWAHGQVSKKLLESIRSK